MKKLIEERKSVVVNVEMDEQSLGLWKKYGGKDDATDHLLTVMGFNPNKPVQIKKMECPKCKEMELVVKERHPDTDMSYMAYFCNACKYEKEI